MTDDERALMMLEKEQIFRPFAMLLDEKGEIERLENHIENVQDSYMALYEEIKFCVDENIVLLSDTTLPENLKEEEGIGSAIRVHLEERSQQYKKIAGRYIYVPYQLQRLAGTEEIKAKLFTPQAVSFPSEFLKKK